MKKYGKKTYLVEEIFLFSWFTCRELHSLPRQNQSSPEAGSGED
jgi:hypothetical protein